MNGQNSTTNFHSKPADPMTCGEASEPTRGQLRLRGRLTLSVALALICSTAFAQDVVDPREGNAQPRFGGGASAAAASGRYIAFFKPGTTPSQRVAAAFQAGAAPFHIYSISSALAVRVPNENALAGLRNNPLVTNVVPDRVHFLHAKGGKPAGPEDLAASTSTNGILLTWSYALAGVTGFEIQRCEGVGCTNFASLITVASTTFSYEDISGLSANAIYRYQVRANFSTGPPSNFSNIAEAMAPGGSTTPAAPTGLTATTVSNDFVDLVWTDNSSNETGFEIARCSGPGCTPGASNVIASVPVDTTIFHDSSLSASTTYRYSVRASGTGTPSAFSNVVQVTTASDPVEPPPTAPCTRLTGTQQQIPLGVQRAGLPTCASNGEGIGVAIVDTGIDFNHPDLAPSPDNPGVLIGDGTATGTSFNALSPGTTCQDNWSHGTHVAGLVAALDNNTGSLGVAPNATLYCVKVGATDAGEIFEADIFAGLEWVIARHDQVDPPIRVVNISSGGPVGENPILDQMYHDLVQDLYNLGVVVVTSAGNDASKQISETVPAGFPEVFPVAGSIAESGVQLCDPALLIFLFGQNLDPVLADSAASFTTDGPGIIASAVAEERVDAIPTSSSCFFLFYGTLSTTLGGGASRKLPTPANGLAEARGTSFAAPIVAGIVARIMQRDLADLTGSAADVETIRDEIQASVDRSGTAPLDHPWGGTLVTYTFDGVREGIAQAPADPAP